MPSPAALRLQLANVTGKGGLAMLRSNQADFAVGSMLDVPDDITYQPFRRYDPMLILPVGHPLADKPDENFVLNNALTYADQRLSGPAALLRGWVKFGLTCSIGLLTNIGVAAALVRFGVHTYPAALSGIVIGSVWNYALSSRFVWGRYG